MRKAIVKTRLLSRMNFVSTLSEIGYNFEPAYWQHDRIFVPRNYQRDRNQPRLSLRTVVKTDGQRIYAIVMRQHVAKEKLDIIHRTIVDDYTEAAHIVYGLGYEFYAEVSRRREELEMGDMVKIYIDHIDGLEGYYAKIETILNENETSTAALDDLVETYKVLGEKRVQPLELTYGELIESAAHNVESVEQVNANQSETNQKIDSRQLKTEIINHKKK